MSRFGIVLAAGTSSRMERAKALLRLDGVPLVEHACRTIEAAGATPIVVVGARAQYIVPAIRDRRWVENERYAQGMATSVATGVREVCDEASAICILPVDQPGIDSAHLRRLFEAAATEGLAATRHPDGNLGAPAAFGPLYFEELMELEGRSGAKAIIARERPTSFNAEFPQDVDTPADWRKFVRTYHLAPHRLPSYEVDDGQVCMATSHSVSIEPGGILMVDDRYGRNDLDTFRELGDEDTEETGVPREDAVLTELAHAAQGVRERLETYMIQGIEIDPDMFWSHFVENPFVRPFTMGLVWQAWREDVWQTIYLSDECTPLTLDDVEIEKDSRFRVPHPLELDNLDAWSQKFAEVELVNTIEQLERPRFDLVEAPTLHHVDPLSFHHIALGLGFEPSDTSLNSYSVALTRRIRQDTIYLSATPGYPFRFPDDHEQSIELTYPEESGVARSEAGLIWDRLRRRLNLAGGYVVY